MTHFFFPSSRSKLVERSYGDSPERHRENALETLFQVMDAEPAAPRLLNPRIPIDLETVCLKCLEKKPADRYPTALDLAEDLRAVLAGTAIRARRTVRKPTPAILSHRLLISESQHP